MSLNPVVETPWVIGGALALLALVVAGLVWSRRSERTGWLLRGAMVLLLALVALRPGIGEVERPTRTADLELVVAVDRTTSMSARDWGGAGDQARLDGVREDVRALVDLVPTARVTLVSFGRGVSTELPSTQDDSLISTTLDLLRRERVFAGTGSRLDRPLPHLDGLLRAMQERNPDRPRLLVVMSDGENTDPQGRRSFARLADRIDGGAVLGYGTAAGATMPVDEDDPGRGVVVDSATGEPALSRLDEDNLRTVAEQLDVPYLHRTGPGGLEDLTGSWRSTFRTVEDPYGPQVPAQVELTWMLALLLLALAALDLRTHLRRALAAGRDVRRPR